MSIKEILRGTNSLLFSDTLALWGFLANLGIVTLTYAVLYLFSTYVFSFEGFLFLTKLHIFSITYWVLLGIIYKTSIGKNNNFNAGFLLSAIFVTLTILANYIRNIL